MPDNCESVGRRNESDASADKGNDDALGADRWCRFLGIRTERKTAKVSFGCVTVQKSFR